jgi:hypothetical protein
MALQAQGHDVQCCMLYTVLEAGWRCGLLLTCICLAAVMLVVLLVVAWL